MADRYYRTIVGIVGLVILIYASLIFPPTEVFIGFYFLLVILAGLLIQFPIRLLNNDITLLPVVVLGGGLIGGPVPAGWAVSFGIILGLVFQAVYSHKLEIHQLVARKFWIYISYRIGLVCIPLILTLPIFRFFNNLTVNLGEAVKPPVIWASVVYMLLYAVLVAGALIFYPNRKPYPKILPELAFFLGIEILSVIFVSLVVSLYPANDVETIALFSGIPVLVAYLLHQVNSTRIEYERRGRELSTLNHISKTIRSTLDLDALLPVIQEQVMQLLEVDNFYVALVDHDTGELWYPFAVKFGQKQNWTPRTMSDRLTDRVIQDRQPILLTPQTQAILAPVGLPPSEETPSSWLGVPLISSDRTIGCLAVFTLEPGNDFTPADADILTILSGQASVAIENALLYQQIQHRAHQLETLNQLTASITASLKLSEVLEKVCNSVAQVGGSQQSAIYLLDSGGDTVSLAHAHGLNEQFKQRNASFPIVNNRRTICLFTGEPNVVQSVNTTSLPVELVLQYQADDIQAYVDLPLITPDGQIGFLSVYFNETHEFSDEEVGVLQTFASQAALVVANARLHAQTDAALTQRVNQLITLEAVGRELSAASHSDQLFGLLLKYAVEMTNSCCGWVASFEPNTNKMIVMSARGYSVSNDEFPIYDGITGRVARTHRTENIGNVTSDPDYIDLRDGDINSLLSVPIIHDNRLLGIITLESLDNNGYSDSEESFVTQLANHAAIDIINAELFHETQHRLQELSTLYQVSTSLVSAVSPDHVSRTITQAIDSVIHPQEIGIYNWMDDGQKYVLIGQANKHLSAEIKPSSDLTHQLSLESGMLAIESEHLDLGRSGTGCRRCRVFIFPLEITQQNPGLLTLHLAQGRQITKNEIELIKVIIAQGAVALQNARNFLEAKNGHDRLIATLNSIDEGILMIDTKGYVLLANEPIRLLTGLNVDEFLNGPIFNMPDRVLKTLGYNRSELRSVINMIGRLQAPVSPKTSFKVQDSQRLRVIERLATPIWGHDGVIIGLMILLRDVTEEHEIEQTRETITETIVHDLRSPMSAIVGALELLSDTLGDSNNPIIQQTLLVGQRSAKRVLSLTEALLDIARLQSGRMEIEIVDIDVPSLVKELMIEFTALANENSVIIRNEIPDKLPKISADLDKFIRVVTNLVDNAVKFSPQGGHVILSAQQETSRFLTIRVTDSGLGVPPDYREKIFDRFVQVPGQSVQRRGTGLGLAFCRLTVEAHGGKIWVDANPQGGSVFSFRMPITSAYET